MSLEIFDLVKDNEDSIVHKRICDILLSFMRKCMDYVNNDYKIKLLTERRIKLDGGEEKIETEIAKCYIILPNIIYNLLDEIFESMTPYCPLHQQPSDKSYPLVSKPDFRRLLGWQPDLGQ